MGLLTFLLLGIVTSSISSKVNASVVDAKRGASNVLTTARIAEGGQNQTKVVREHN